MIFEDEKEFNKFREANSHMRFWEALKAYSGVDDIIVRYNNATVNTEYFQSIKIK